MRGSWGPLDRRQPSREAQTIKQHQIQCTEMDGDEEAQRGGFIGGAAGGDARPKCTVEERWRTRQGEEKTRPGRDGESGVMNGRRSKGR